MVIFRCHLRMSDVEMTEHSLVEFVSIYGTDVDPTLAELVDPRSRSFSVILVVAPDS